MTQYKEVKRKARVGERIRVIGVHREGIDVGEELTVDRVDGQGDIWSVKERSFSGLISYSPSLFGIEYVVLEPVASFDQLYDKFRTFILDNADAVRGLLGETAPVFAIDSAGNVKAEGLAVTAPLTRAEVIEKARADVSELERIGVDFSGRLPQGTPFATHFYVIEFVVNRAKRTVTALVSKGEHKKRKPDAIGIARCTPDDVFNADIGKAIAARRALGLTVPDEYINAPKPDEKRVGMFVNYKGYHVLIEPPNHVTGRKYDYATKGNCGIGSIVANNGTIIDDTDVDYSVSTAREAA